MVWSLHWYLVKFECRVDVRYFLKLSLSQVIIDIIYKLRYKICQWPEFKVNLLNFACVTDYKSIYIILYKLGKKYLFLFPTKNFNCFDNISDFYFPFSSRGSKWYTYVYVNSLLAKRTTLIDLLFSSPQFILNMVNFLKSLLKPPASPLSVKSIFNH